MEDEIIIVRGIVQPLSMARDPKEFAAHFFNQSQEVVNEYKIRALDAVRVIMKTGKYDGRIEEWLTHQNEDIRKLARERWVELKSC